MKLLLESNHVNPNIVDRNGETPLLIASCGPYEGVLKLLLERNDVNPNIADGYSKTSLHIAACKGHGGIVKLLLERNDVDPNIAQYGETPLFIAACEGHEGVVKGLLECNKVNPNTTNSSGRTPLFIAASKGHEGVVKVLLERNDVNPNIGDWYNETPLRKAPYEWLKRRNVNPNTPKGSIVTPLTVSASNGHEAVVKMLLQRADVNSDIRDFYGKTALSRAQMYGHHSIVNLLSEHTNFIPQFAGDEFTAPSTQGPSNLNLRRSKRIRRI